GAWSGRGSASKERRTGADAAWCAPCCARIRRSTGTARGSGNEGWRWSWSWRGGATRRRLRASKRAWRRRSVVEAVESRTSLREGKTMAANNNGGKRMRASVGLLAACAGVVVAARAEAAGPRTGLALPTQREERWGKDRQT